VIVVPPVLSDVARPCEPAALLIVAVAGVAEPHVTVVVRSCVELSVYTPVAVNCCVRPLAILGRAGVTPIETSVAAATVSVVLPDTAPRVAVIAVLPTLTVVTRPREPAALLIVATAGVAEDHVTVVVRFCVELSVYTPVAVNC
jgi:hypothetical protein